MKSLPNIQEQIKILGSELNVMSDMLKSIDDVCFLKDDESKGLENLSKKISEQHLYNTYSGINKYLAEKDEYQKSLYIRMLCVVVQYGGSIENGQEAYLQKLIEDCQLENKLEDFLREALCFDMEEFKAFIEVFGNNVLSCYFCIDSLILVSFEQNSEGKYNLLADIFCALGITKDELQFLSKVSCSVVEQNGELFDEAKESVPDSVEYQDFIFYVKDFYEESLDNAYHFYSKELTDLTETEIHEYRKQEEVANVDHVWSFNLSRVLGKIDRGWELEFENNDVVIENKIIRSFYYNINSNSRKRNISFSYCNSIQFVNCFVYISNGIEFNNCKDVHFINCHIVCIDSSIRLEKVGTFQCSGCTIICVDMGSNVDSFVHIYGKTKVLLEDNDFPLIKQGLSIYRDSDSCYADIIEKNKENNNFYEY